VYLAKKCKEDATEFHCSERALFKPKGHLNLYRELCKTAAEHGYMSLTLPDTLTREEESRLINDGFLITKTNGIILINWEGAK
jgi:hypothetical protein